MEILLRRLLRFQRSHCALSQYTEPVSGAIRQPRRKLRTRPAGSTERLFEPIENSASNELASQRDEPFELDAASGELGTQHEQATNLRAADPVTSHNSPEYTAGQLAEPLHGKQCHRRITVQRRILARPRGRTAIVLTRLGQLHAAQQLTCSLGLRPWKQCVFVVE